MDLEVIEKQLGAAVAEFKAVSAKLADLEARVADSAKASGGEADAKIAALRNETEAKYSELDATIKALGDERVARLSEAVEAQKSRIAELEASGQRPGSGGTGGDSTPGEAFGDLARKNEDAFLALKSGGRRPGEMPVLALDAHRLLPGLAGKSVTSGAATRMVAPMRGADVDLIGRRALRLRELIPSLPTDRNAVEYLAYQGMTPATAKSVSGITRSGTTATATTSASHGYRSNDKVRIAGADQAAYNGDFRITVASATTFTYTVAGSPATPATGTITASRLNQFGAAAGRAEAGATAEASMLWTLQTASVINIGHYVAASREVIDDVPGLQAKIDNELIYGLGYRVDYELLWGTGTGNSLTGLTNATGALTSLWSAGVTGDTRADALRRAQTKLARIDRMATVAVVSPDDWEYIEIAKGSDGHYLWMSAWNGDGIAPILWRVPVVVTTAMDPGKFLLLDAPAAATIYARQEAQLRFSDQHSDFFTTGQVALLAEVRLALAITNPEAIVNGQFDSAPA